MDKKIRIGLLEHLYKHENLGCVALSIANVTLIDKAAKNIGKDIEYKILVTDNIEKYPLEFTENKYEYLEFPRCKQTLKNPIRLLKSRVYNDCDIIVNISGGDGFTDIYGFGRVLAESYMTIFAGMKKKKVIFAPQTIGPFKKKISRAIAKKTLSYVQNVFSRDALSSKCCEELNAKEKCTEVIDVAFALPFKKMEFGGNKIKLGINVSGLLYNGGYNHNNYFGLSFNYKEFIEKTIELALEKNYEVHLVPHVNSDNNKVEDDYDVCKMLAEKYNVKVAPRYMSPIDIKSYIAGLDVFTGARMHSTIAAFSSGVPVIPIAYSRKFNGLYGTLEYPYFIDAKSDINLNQALNKLFEYIDNREQLKETMEKGKNIYTERLNRYVKYLEEILNDGIN